MWTGPDDVEAAVENLTGFRRALRRWLVPLLAWIAVCVVLGLAYLKTTRPDFIATTQIVLQSRQVAEDGPEALRRVHQIALDSEQAETQQRVISSERLLRSVFDTLKLSDAVELGSGQNGLWSRVAGLLHRLAPSALPFDPQEAAFAAFSDRVRSHRDELSYVIEISYRAQTAIQAARVANAVTSAYLRDRVANAIAASNAQAPYLQRRASEMLVELLATEQAIEAGTLPTIALPDADVRALGPAPVPRTKLFPKAVPLLLVASCLGLVSGLLLIAFADRPRPPPFARPTRRPGMLTVAE